MRPGTHVLHPTGTNVCLKRLSSLKIGSGHSTGSTATYERSPLRRWMPSRCDPVPPHSHCDQIVQVQRHDRRASGRGTANDQRPILTPTKMPPPPLPSRIEQTNSTPCYGIGPVSLVAFAKITCTARQPQIILGIRPSFGPWDDVLDFQRPGDILLARKTIPTTVCGGRTDFGAQRLRDRVRHYGASGSRRPRRTASANAADWRSQSR